MHKSTFSKLWAWVGRHKLDVSILLVILAASGVVSAVNMTGYPQRFEDEGTYVSEAWAVESQGTLAHYTYWYDHPPAGWLQMAAYFVVFHGLERYGSAITAGREFMLVLHLATIGLIYALARRMRLGKLAAAGAAALYGFSPLSVEFGRYVLLDNIGLPWLLSALLLALSPRRNLAAAIGAAICMALAVLSKETLLVLLPVVLYCLWRTGDRRNRRYTLAAFGVVFSLLCATYVLYAALKGELIPGAGHVSLLGSLAWQLHGRAGSGSIFDPSSGTYGLVTFWLHIDYYLIAAGILGLIPALVLRNLRPAGLALLIGLAMLLRTGYLPFPYVVAILPFAALCFAGSADWLVSFIRSRSWLPLRVGGALTAVELAIALALVVIPAWQTKLYASTTQDDDASSRQAVAWIVKHVAPDNRLVVESAMWSDLEDKGFSKPRPVWLYKTETDPAVKKEVGGWRGINYVILDGPTVGAPSFPKSFPTVATAIKHGQLVATFGNDNQKILVYHITGSKHIAANSAGT